MTAVAALPYPTRRPAPSLATAVVVLVSAMRVGTGGLETADYYKARSDKGYAYGGFAPAPVLDVIPIVDVIKRHRTPIDDLGHIRTVLRPSISDLAWALGVSRQAIYDWQNGKTVTAGNAARLADLALAADVFDAKDVTGSAQLLRRPITENKTLFDIAREGGSAETAARVLVARVGREVEQRARLAARLAGRKPAKGGSDDYGSPILDESV